MEIPIIYEDENVLAINKPAGLVVHSDSRTEEETLADWILEKYPETKNVGEPLVASNVKSQMSIVILRPGIVHRLDRETSGAMLIAKNQKAFDFLKEKFQTKEIEKTYKAFVYGELKSPEDGDEGEINRPIGRSAKDFRLWSAQRGARGKMREAITKYRVLARFKIPRSSASGPHDSASFSLVEARPLTGRTHQIRVHFKAINYPIVCDKLYAPKRECALGFNRLALHSRKIKFTNLDEKELEIEAPYPEDFKKALKIFGM